MAVAYFGREYAYDYFPDVVFLPLDSVGSMKPLNTEEIIQIAMINDREKKQTVAK